MRPDPMEMMRTCFGQCDQVPDEVSDAVFESLKRIPRVNDDRGDRDERDARAADMAPYMATAGWRFCPCFPMLRTRQHELIFGLVHTNLANRLAHKEARATAASAAEANVRNAA